MTKDKAPQFLPLIQAWAEGKTIQLNIGTAENPDWNDRLSCDFSNRPDFYRIKPEPPKPREWSLFVSPDGELHHCKHSHNQATPIRVREIIEE